MNEAIHLRFDAGNAGHQKITMFMAGANCGQLTMKPEEAIWLHHICMKGCEFLGLSFNASGKCIDPAPEEIDKFAVDHDRER